MFLRRCVRSARFSPPVANRSANGHSRLYRHSRTQEVLRIRARIEPDPNREPLHHLDVVPGGVLGWEEAEKRAGGTGEVLDLSGEVAVETIHVNFNRFARVH